MVKNCLKCNKDFKVSPNVIKKGNGKYCSNLCKIKYLWANDEYRKHMSNAHKGQIPTNIDWLVKNAKTDKHREKMRNLRKGKIGFWKDKKRPELSGENNPRWIKDRTKLAKYSNGEEYRNSSASREWMLSVKKRDFWKCKISNNNCSGRLEAHHILGWAEYPELRYEINNGITLCHAHHPRKRAEEKRLIPTFQELVSVSK